MTVPSCESCSACGGTASFHAKLFERLEIAGDGEYRSTIDAVAEEVTTLSERLQILDCIRAEDAAPDRDALIDLVAAVESLEPTETLDRSILTDAIRPSLFDENLGCVDSALEALRDVGDESVRADIIAVIERHMEDPGVVERGLEALTYLSEDFDPCIDGLLVSLIELGGTVAFEATFVLAAYMDSDRRAAINALEMAALSDDPKTGRLARIGLAKRGNPAYAPDVATELALPWEDISLHVFEAAGALKLRQFCPRLQEIFAGLPHDSEDSWDGTLYRFVRGAITACCTADDEAATGQDSVNSR